MGNNVSDFQKICDRKSESKLLSLSLEQLKHYYSHFKATCENFCIDFTEFKSIFNESKEIFDLWDKNETCLIDALELFSGLILYSETKFNEKIKLLFEIFDFNDLNSLSMTDIEFIMHCCVTSALRICGSKEDSNQDEINNLTEKHFSPDIRVNLSQLIEFCNNSEEIISFFRYMKKDYPSKDTVRPIELIKIKENPDSKILSILRTPGYNSSSPDISYIATVPRGGNIHNSNRTLARNKFIESTAGVLRLEKEKKYAIKTANLSLNWVYGFRCADSIRSFVYHAKENQPDDLKNLDQKIIYFVANVVVLYYFKLNKQRHYTEHKSPVGAIALSTNNFFCATGETGTSARIHIWNIETLETVLTIHTENRKDIYLLEFIQNDDYLITVCKRHDSPLFVYELAKGTVIMSTGFTTFITHLIPIVDLSGVKNEQSEEKLFFSFSVSNSFACQSKTALSLFGWNQSTKQISVITVYSVSPEDQQNGVEITHCCALYINRGNPKTSIYSQTNQLEVVFYIGTNTGLFMRYEIDKNPSQKVPNPSDWIESQALDLKYSIEQIILFRKDLICIATKNAMLHLYDLKTRDEIINEPWKVAPNLKHKKGYTQIAMEFQTPKQSTRSVFVSPSIERKQTDRSKIDFIIQTLDLTKINVRLESMNIKTLVAGNNKTIFISTWEGDIAKISMRHKQVWHQSLLINQAKGKKIQTIAHFPNSLTAICYLNISPEETLIYFGGQDSTLFCFSSKSHQIVRQWKLKYPVTAIAGFVNPQGSIIFAVGLSSGEIVFFINHQEKWSNLPYPKSVHILQFSKQGKYLFVSYRDNIFRIYPIKKRGIEETTLSSEHKLNNSEVIISANFFEEPQDIILIQTSIQKYFLYTISKTNLAELTDTAKINCNMLKLFYESSDSRAEKGSHFIFDKKLGAVIFASEEGYISFFESLDTLRGNFETAFFGHSSGIADLELDIKRKVLYTVGKNDNSVFEWKVDIDKEILKPINRGSKGASLNVEGIEREIMDKKKVKSTIRRLEDSIGYFSGYSKEDLNIILNLKPQNEFISSLPKKYPEYSIELHHIYCMQTYDVRNNFCYIHVQKDIKRSSFTNENSKYNISNSQMNVDGFLQKQTSRIDYNYDTLHYDYSNESMTQRHASENLSPSKAFQRNKARDWLQPPNTNHSKFAPVNESENKIGYQESNTDSEENHLHSVYASYGRCANHGASCMRKIVYFVSRVVVIVDPLNLNVQKFYQGHSSKISVMTIHPRITLIATGEKCFLPKIHVWNPINCQNIMVCDTQHQSGIITVRFSVDKFYLLSISVDESSSIQVSDWRTGKIIAFRNAFSSKIVNAQFNPIDETSFCTASMAQVDCWRIIGNSIVHLSQVEIPNNDVISYVTDLFYINQYISGRLQTDILISISSGRLGLIKENRYFEIAIQESVVAISCMKLIIYHNHPILIIAGHDEILKFYTLDFTRVHRIELNYEKRSKAQPHVQSLDAYIKDNVLHCIAGLRTGILIEVEINLGLDPIKNALIFHDVKNNSLIKGHVPLTLNEDEGYKGLIDKQVMFSLHQELSLMVSIGPDHMLYFWNTEERTPTNIIELTKQPTCVKFTPNMRFLVIGFIDGSLKFYSMTMVRDVNAINLTLEKESKGDEFTLHQKEISDAVLNIEFSNDSNLVAVSYINSNQKIEKEGAKVIQAGPIINIYASKDTSKKDSKNKKENAYNFHVTLQPATHDQSSTGEGSDIGISCYFMAFSSDCNYLVVYYQRIYNRLHARDINDSSGKYVVYSLSNRALHHSANIIEPIHVSTLYFPNHLSGKRIFSSSNILSLSQNEVDSIENAAENLNSKITISCIASKENLAALGSHNGEIYLTRTQMVYRHDNRDARSDLSKLKDMSKYDSTNSDRCLRRPTPIDKAFQAKRYAAHSSYVNQMEFKKKKDEDYLFTSAIKDECIYQWKVTKSETVSSQVDQLLKDESREVYYIYEVEEQKVFKSNYIERLKLRSTVRKITENTDRGVFPKYRLNLKSVLGRRAFTQRSNLIMISNQKLLYSSGSAMVILEVDGLTALPDVTKDLGVSANSEKNYLGVNNGLNNLVDAEDLGSLEKLIKKQHDDAQEKTQVDFIERGSYFKDKKFKTAAKIRQSFMFPQKANMKLTAAEVGCFEAAPDKETLVIATKEEHSRLFIWDICSDSFKGLIVLHECVSPLIMRISYDSQFLVCCGVTSDYTPCLYYCNIKKFQVLGMLDLKFNNPRMIADITFIPGDNARFMSVGFMHFFSWKYQADILNFRKIHLWKDSKISKTDLEDPITEGRKTQNNWFLAIKFFTPELFVLADDAGWINLCDEEKIYDRQQVFSHSPVTTITKMMNEEMEFAVAGFDANIILYRICMSNNSKPHLLKTISLWFDEFDLQMTVVVKNDKQTASAENPTQEIAERLALDNREAENQVQSLLHVGNNTFIIGTRDGSIYKLSETKLSTHIMRDCKCTGYQKSILDDGFSFGNKIPVPAPAQALLRFADHHCPKVADFSKDEEILFTISDHGYFMAYDLTTLKCFWSHNFAQEVVNMHAFENCVIVIFKKEAVIIDLQHSAHLITEKVQKRGPILRRATLIQLPDQNQTKPEDLNNLDSRSRTNLQNDTGIDLSQDQNLQKIIHSNSHPSENERFDRLPHRPFTSFDSEKRTHNKQVYYHRSFMSRCGTYLAIIVSSSSLSDESNEVYLYKLEKDRNPHDSLLQQYIVPYQEKVSSSKVTFGKQSKYSNFDKYVWVFQRLEFEKRIVDCEFVDFSESEFHHIIVASLKNGHHSMYKVDKGNSTIEFLGQGGISSDRHQFQGMGLTLFENTKGLFKEFTDNTSLFATLNLGNDAVITVDKFGAVVLLDSHFQVSGLQ